MKKYGHLPEKFVKLLEQRGLTPAQVVHNAGCGRVAAYQVLAGKRPGHQIRRRLAPHLTKAELQALGWEPGGGHDTLVSLLAHKEREAVQTVIGMLEQFESGREPLDRILRVVAEHPEVFGELKDGETYLERAAECLEKLVPLAAKIDQVLHKAAA